MTDRWEQIGAADKLADQAASRAESAQTQALVSIALSLNAIAEVLTGAYDLVHAERWER